MKQVAPLRYGVIFKKAFCDVDIFKGFVRDILGIEIEIDHVETEKKFEHTVGRVKPEFDLFAEDKKNRIIMDIQHKRHSDHYDRFLHYHCAAMLEQISTSKDYKAPLTVYTIVVLTSGDKYKCDVSTIDFDPKKLNGEPLGAIKHKIIYLCPKYADENTPLLYQEWLRVIDDSLDGQVDEQSYHLSEIQKVMLRIEQDGISPEEKSQMIEEYHQEEFESEMLEKGIQQGIKQGIEQGELKAKQTIAKNLLASNLDIQTIVTATGLNVEEIEQLRDNV